MTAGRCVPHHRSCSTYHAQLVATYRDARHAWESLRESGTLVPAAYAHGGAVACYQLEDADYRAAYPPPLFRHWLVEFAAHWRTDD